MYRYSLLPGDRLLVMKDAVIDNAITHSGTYMGNGFVAHMSPSKGLVVEPIEAFAGSQEFQVVQKGGIPEQLLRERLEQYQTDAGYRLFESNCEHLCSFLETGKAQSRQLQGAVAGLAGGYIAVRALGVQNPWVATLLIALTTYAGAKIGAPKPSLQGVAPAH